MKDFGLILSCTVHRFKTEYDLPEQTPAIENILTLVCSHLNIYRQYLFVKDRKTRRVYARHLTMYVLRESGRLSPEEIAEVFDCHTNTVEHGLKTIDNQRAYYDDLQRDLREIFLLLNDDIPPIVLVA